jgi:hypothetical protein
LITVIVDTTATFVDVMMKNTRWMQLLTLCARSELQLVVPDVVVRETARHWEREALEAIQTAHQRIERISKSQERFDELGLDADQLPDATSLTTTADREKFHDATRERLLGLGVDLRPVPDDVSIETVLARDLDSKKPFERSGKGFRDALIWETTREIVLESADGDFIFFVTDNSADYCDDGGVLAPELLEEVHEGLGTLVRVKDLDDLMSSEQLAPVAARLEKSDAELALFLSASGGPAEPDYEPPTVGQVVRDAVLSAIDELVNDDVETANATTSGHNFTELMIPSELEGLSISSIDADESTLDWQTYETYDDTTLLIRAEVVADVELGGFAYKSDAVGMDRLHVLDWDWNDHMARISIGVRPRLIFQVRVEQGLDFAEECDLEGVEPSELIDDDHPWPKGAR